mmetsp:Transcript_20580/g.48358  ORF Transcript_20580/g.48358 Transcript_20580/m.48358 type:complete len:251 (+) Transcript_20580:110-862(+)
MRHLHSGHGKPIAIDIDIAIAIATTAGTVAQPETDANGNTNKFPIPFPIPFTHTMRSRPKNLQNCHGVRLFLSPHGRRRNAHLEPVAAPDSTWAQGHRRHPLLRQSQGGPIHARESKGLLLSLHSHDGPGHSADNDRHLSPVAEHHDPGGHRDRPHAPGHLGHGQRERRLRGGAGTPQRLHGPLALSVRRPGGGDPQPGPGNDPAIDAQCRHLRLARLPGQPGAAGQDGPGPDRHHSQRGGSVPVRPEIQ